MHEVNFYNVCVACGERIPEGYSKLSCPACGSNVFKLVREGKEEEKREEEKNLLPIRQNREKVETVRVLRRGVFEIDLEALFKGAPPIVSDREGAYRIPLNQLKVRGQR
ncbi:MAG: hypothetical protein QXW47_07780 [Candidatus Jordarchaeales archaeon]